MSYQLYCIFRRPLPATLEIADGVEGYRVFTANYNGLGAALSKGPESDRAADASSLLAYEKVVESFYRQQTVIPLRYGCQVECPYDAVTLLRVNHQAYSALLQELQGLAEMGIQVLVDNSLAGAEADRLVIPPEWFPSRSGESDAAYRDANEPRYVGVQPTAVAERALVDDLCGWLHGFFVRHKVEFASSRKSGLLSLHSLVPRDSVETFRQTACHLPPNPSVKLLLSGPLPPYDFVDGLLL